jgi:TnpA family transposase
VRDGFHRTHRVSRFKRTPTAQNLHVLYTLEGLLQNAAEIHPETVHADTQGQSAPVFHESRKNRLYQAFRELGRVVCTIGGEGIIAENDPEEQEKIIKYIDFVANAVIFQNVVDVSQILRELIAEGYPVNRADVAAIALRHE